MLRVIHVVVALVALVGAVGFAATSHAMLGHYEWLTWNVATQLPDASTNLPWCAMSAIVLGIALAIACVIAIKRSVSEQRLPVGKGLGLLAGGLFCCAAVFACLHLLLAKQWFYEISTQARAPKVSDVQEIVSRGSRVTAAGVALVVACALLVVTALIGWKDRADQIRREPKHIFVIGLSLITALAVCLFSASMNAGIGQLTEMSAMTTAVKPSDIARAMLSIAAASLMLFATIGVQGIVVLLTTAFGGLEVRATGVQSPESQEVPIG